MTKQKINYCLLAKTVPEYSKRDNTVYTCSIGYSPQLGLMRLYPLPPKGMKKWGIYEVEVERNKRDSRVESWKLSSMTRKNNWANFGEDLKHIGTAKPEKVLPLLLPSVSPSISQLNEDRKSIGLVSIGDQYRFKWQANDKFINTTQIGMFEDVELADFTKYTKHTKDKESRVIFKDGDGKHDLQFNEWGIYEFQRKFGAKPEAFRFLVGKKDQYLLIGNMLQYRRNWIGLSLFNLPQQACLNF